MPVLHPLSVHPLSAHLATVVLALAIEAVCGYPDWLFRAIRHPVVWAGWLIDRLERRLNRPPWPRAGGIVATLALLAAAVAPSLAAGRVAPLAVTALLASTLLAQRSLWRHVADVASGLEAGLAEGRTAVARIVGRNTARLDAAGVARAAIESLAENFSDGVVAPAFWCACAGLPGIAAYKALNTADSMIGHRTPRHAAFGWAAARLDDVVNLPASRLAALWIVLAAVLHRADARAAVRAVWRDAPRHRSPNAGWPEAAMAGALGLRLAGPRVYGDTLVDDAWMGGGRAGATVADLRRALRLYRTACAIQFAVALAVWLIARG